MKKRNLNLANPVTLTANRIASFFAKDEGVQTVFDFKRKVLRLYCQDDAKAEALNKIMKVSYQLGGLSLTVGIYPSNGRRLQKFTEVLDPAEKFEIFKVAFKSNPLVKKFSVVTDAVMQSTWFFCETAKQICQYQADDLQNPYGFQSVLPSDLLKEITRSEGLQISTWAQD